jgi:hypothetical protein
MAILFTLTFPAPPLEALPVSKVTLAVDINASSVPRMVIPELLFPKTVWFGIANTQ